MQSHTVWGGIESSSVGSKEHDADTNSSVSSGDPHRRVPDGITSYLAQVDFRDNSSSTSSVVTDDLSLPGSGRQRNGGKGTENDNGEVAQFLKNRLANRMGGDEAGGASPDPRKKPGRGDRSAKGGGDGDGQVEVTPEDRQVFDQVIIECGLWSKGCAQHNTRKCRPCHYVHCKSGCSNGGECDFCHFPHTDKNRQRIGMSKRLYCKGIAQLLEDACQADGVKFEQVVRASSTMSSYLHSILLERLQQKLTGGASPSGGDLADLGGISSGTAFGGGPSAGFAPHGSSGGGCRGTPSTGFALGSFLGGGAGGDEPRANIVSL
eukprot:CAMPEP_0203897926 /NCGR_PEP_ID=MMETSP0359-20131031/40503_1 /ASSEMBLY_ACC=CAM_ASM_000338 /TAXON_ID=268821 /ORGANISM="Scrippsiella Hangoei, Strain SHTV-5" /LENGTH=320 /DNA_ID=CAMNT_0050820905 /DNA_START=65 /DNA_END=1027 /DNA_ORIENTATION=-